MKFFYFVADSSDVIFSFNKGKKCFYFIAILYGELCILFTLGLWLICLLHRNGMLFF